MRGYLRLEQRPPLPGEVEFRERIAPLGVTCRLDHAARRRGEPWVVLFERASRMRLGAFPGFAAALRFLCVEAQ